METLATEKQISFITKLASEREVSLSNVETISKYRASEIISELLAMPKVVKPSKVFIEGIYYKNGVVYKVQISETSGRPYAKVLQEKGGFSYDPSAIRNISPEDKITIEQAKSYGIQYGVCCVCGRLLTDSVSVSEGIGPVCGKRI